MVVISMRKMKVYLLHVNVTQTSYDAVMFTPMLILDTPLFIWSYLIGLVHN